MFDFVENARIPQQQQSQQMEIYSRDVALAEESVVD